jgi:hypothetical protein
MVEDGTLFEIAEFLREEAKTLKVVGPRYYEGWEIVVSVPDSRSEMHFEKRWRLSARKRNRGKATPTEIAWLTQLARLVSEGRAEGPFETPKDPKETMNAGGIRMTHIFVWFTKDDDEEEEIKLDDEETDDDG